MSITALELRGHARQVRGQEDSLAFRVVTSGALDRAADLADEVERCRALVAELQKWDADMTRGWLWTVLENHGFGDPR